MSVSTDLIFDVGMHKGEDAEFYLKKGFRVVGIEAVESFCTFATQRFAEAVNAGRLVIVNKAIATNEREVSFYLNESVSFMGTLDAEWVARNALKGAPSTKIAVAAVRFEQLLEKFGVPYYLKVDIEGADLLCIEALRTSKSRPLYVSIESTKTSFEDLLREFEIFEELGYHRFKIVNQRRVPKQEPPNPPLEGSFATHRFTRGASGLFGEEAPGVWLSRSEAIAQYKKIFRHYYFFGDDGLFERNRTTHRLARALGFRNDWYDTHARLG